MNYSYSFQTGEAENLNQIASAVSSPHIFRESFDNKFAPANFGREEVRNNILRNLSSEVFQSLAPHLEKVNLGRGQELCEADNDISHIYFPETAVTGEFQILADGKTTGVAMIGSEGMLGVSALLGAPVSTNWAQTLAAGTAFKINANVMRQYFDYCKIVKKNVLEYLHSYLVQISQKAVCNNHHQVVERLCGWILMLDDRCQSRGCPLSLTQEQLAFFLGAQRPSITTVTQTLREKGMINYKRGKLIIINRSLLESAACGCYKAAQGILQ
jgi:CRP-like cAMP-binding protein